MSSFPGLVLLVLIEVGCQKQELKFIQERPDVITFDVAVKNPSSDVFFFFQYAESLYCRL